MIVGQLFITLLSSATLAFSHPPGRDLASLHLAAQSASPSNCLQSGCWGGMDRFVGQSFSRFDVTVGRTERIAFYWIEPGEMLRMERSSGGNTITQDLRMNTATGVPHGYLILDNGALTTDTAGTEGATRIVYRFDGDRLITEFDIFRRGEWRPWRRLGRRVATAFQSDRTRQQAATNGDGLFGALLRGAAMGVSGVDAPLMNSDGSAPNTLDVLNAANRELAHQNEVLTARGDAIIASSMERSHAEQDEARSPVFSTAGAPSTPEATAVTPPAGSQPVARYGWCYALSSSGDQRITYVSRIGRTERLLANGAMLGGSSSDWHTTVAREWSQQINAPHTNATCTARDTTAEFEPLRRTYTANQQVVEIPWSPR